MQPLLDIVSRTAAVFAIDIDLVNLTKRRLNKGRGRPEEGHNPHPEKRARTAKTNGRRNASDVAGADPAGERHGECLEARNTDFTHFLLEEKPDHFADQSQLKEPAPNRKPKAAKKTKRDQRGRPDKVARLSNKSFHGISQKT